MNAIAATLGLTPEYRASLFDKIIPSVQGGNYNVGMSSFTDSKEREQQVDFVTYFKAGSAWAQKVCAGINPDDACGKKIAVQDGNVATFALVAARSGNGVTLALADLTGPGVKRSAVESIDPTRSAADVTFDGAAAEPLGDEGRGWELLERVLDRAAVLQAFEQLGGAERAFEITREFTLGRYAFGRPVASFQAIKHRLADLWVAIELARSNAYYGAWALAGDEPELPIAACGARVSATDAFDLAATEMVQMHGGVGFTWEYDCHLFYRRSKLLGLALGSGREWRDKLIRRIDARHAA